LLSERARGADFPNVKSDERHDLRSPGSGMPANEQPPRLLLRFALWTAIVLVSAGAAILWTVDREIAARAERTVENHGRVVAEENMRRQLRASDFDRPVTGARLAALDDLFRRRILIPGIVGTRLFNRDGTITYAARHQLIGTRVAYPADIAPVFAGHSRRRVTRTVTWRGKRNVKVLQSLIPVQNGSSRRTVGALELDQDYRAVEVTIGGARSRLLVILAVAFLVLYLALFPILRGVTKQLEARNARLREQALERERLLEAERGARAEAEAIQRLLTEQNDQLRELDRMKDEFVSLVSHELRTPLTSIRGYVELLLEEADGLSGEQKRFLSVVDRNSERLLHLVGDLLFLAQVDAGRLAIDFEELDLSEVVRHSVEGARPVAQAQEIELNASVAPGTAVVGDRARLGQVLDNLISNALKFTPAGGRVSVALADSGGRATIEVADTGLGIAADEQSRLFDRFFRSSRATESAIPGTGLGLTITKAIVDGHGGEITVASEEGAGTTIRVQIPTQPASGARTRRPTRADAAPSRAAHGR
jgi:signal transduction histidine kinase